VLYTICCVFKTFARLNGTKSTELLVIVKNVTHTKENLNSKTYSGLLNTILQKPVLVLLIFLALGLALLPLRWINPDEGAHLMDAKLLMEGLMPAVDFDSWLK